MKKVRRAIISVTDKTGVEDFARGLADMGVEIISTGGTAALLKKAGVEVVPIERYTGFPEMMDGRLKTLHPLIHGGILGMRDNPSHVKDMEAHGIKPIDMVVVNLYAFEKTVEGGCTLADAIENIDIGGPTMIRAAAKNHRDVATVVDPADYGPVLEELGENKGMLSAATRFNLAKKVYQTTARYDAAISNYLGTVPDNPELDDRKHFPDTFTVQFEKVQDLRYGENPHQAAAFYRDTGGRASGLGSAVKHQGKELSYNNILDLNAAVLIAREFHDPAAVIIKHNNPCGTATSDNGILAAYNAAYECDKTSAFGGIVGFNRRVTADVASTLTEIFLEAVVAPEFDPEALEIFKSKKNLRVVEIGGLAGESHRPEVEIKRVCGGALLQTMDIESASDLKTVTSRGPNEKELSDLLFAWNVCKHVKSNAIILARDGRTVGIGAGQMSRIDSTRIAVMKAADAGLEVKGSVLASDAFFPFRDNVDMAAEQGVTAIVQPGGSIRDKEVIEAADEHGIAMVFTGIRHFRH